MKTLLGTFNWVSVIVKTYGSFAVLDNTQHNTTLDDGSQARSDLCQDDADIDGWKI